MSTPKQLTIEEVDRQIEQASKRYASMPKAAIKGATKYQLDLMKICGVVNIAVPIFKFFANNFGWMKPKWKKILEDVIKIAETTCPTP